jgi:hypothetical protein
MHQQLVDDAVKRRGISGVDDVELASTHPVDQPVQVAVPGREPRLPLAIP